MTWRVGGLLVLLALAYALGEVVWRGFSHPAPPLAAIHVQPKRPAAPAPAVAMIRRGPLSPQAVPDCDAPARYAEAAAANAASAPAAQWSVFGRPELGWETYVVLTQREIGAACPPQTAAFASALAGWQAAQGMPASGVMDAATLHALNLVWLRRRPFVAATTHGACPSPPSPDRLVTATPQEGYETKTVQLRGPALDAYRRMVAAARGDVAEIRAEPRLLTIFSGYRDPAADAARCGATGGCGTAARANCSAHRTGLAMDLFLGAAPGYPPESSADANRLYQSRSAAYRWLVANAARYGFTPYPFEPWHWEWTGEPP